jgi:hypothetical protein
VAWFAVGALIGVPLALLYLRRHDRRGWRSSGPVLLVVLVLASVTTQLASTGEQARAAAYGFTAGILAGAAGWGLWRLLADRRKTS